MNFVPTGGDNAKTQKETVSKILKTYENNPGRYSNKDLNGFYALFFVKYLEHFCNIFVTFLHENNTRGKVVSKVFSNLPTFAIEITNIDVSQGPKYVST